VVPRVYPELCSSRVVVMEFLEGIPLLQVEPREERRRLARILVGEAYKQIFVDGFFHADPHPGNLRYLRDGRIGLLDFGLMGRLTPRMRDLLIRLTIAVAVRDAGSAARIIYSAGIARERIELASLSRDIEGIFGSTIGRSLRDIDTERVAIDLMEVISRHGVMLPSGLAMLGKAGINLEGVVRTLDPEMDISQEALPYARKLVTLPGSPLELATEAFKQVLRFKGMFEELPLQIDQIMMDISSGRLNVNISSRQLDGLVPSLRELGGLLALGMVAAASIVAAAFLIVPYFGEMRLFGIPVLAVLAVWMAGWAGFLMVAVLGWALFRGKDLRIRLSSWIPLLRRRKEFRERKKSKNKAPVA